MPTYVYECRSCGKVFEVDQRITEEALSDCDCGANGALRRLIQPVAVAFKGAGFHINDYAPKGTTTDASESKAAEAAPSEAKSGESAPAESKPAESTPATEKSAQTSPPASPPAKAKSD